MGALRFLGAMEKQMNKLMKSLEKGLMFVEGSINGKVAKNVMSHTSVTHNFISEDEAKILGLKLQKDMGRKKAVNSEVLPKTRVANHVQVKLGT
ncbi:PREDICTED: gag-asp_proteas domain-containing [Prunus dulcis]|uniref:PREDICTED: gag-asp_proteas domain-containing n=1 Tax=Prunus dulcis TaxID=3755 RepID=A0A5E4GG11_PRUDU|nr:PREDICTED: gag-asp_proteas domain-containing [Prunus dulcis]VVA40187.1 PREDICTED: gag-asp_proteas domain-containing [Prunus dulcis]